MGCWFQDLFNIDSIILVQLTFSFFFKLLVSVHVVHLYSRTDTIAAWKKLRFILSDTSDFHIINNLSIAVHAFAIYIYIYISGAEMGRVLLVPGTTNNSYLFKFR